MRGDLRISEKLLLRSSPVRSVSSVVATRRDVEHLTSTTWLWKAQQAIQTSNLNLR